MINVASFTLALSLGSAPDDPALIWKSLAKAPDCPGIVQYGDWLFCCYSETADPLAVGFEDIQRSGAQQEVVEALVAHCCGQPDLPTDLSKPVLRLIKLCVSDRWSQKVSTAGILWVELKANDKETRAVAAMPSRTCTQMPRRGDWRQDGLAIALSSESWIVPAALVEVSDIKDRDQVHSILESRVCALLPTALVGWPAGWIKLPEGIPQSRIDALTVEDLIKVARTRAGDATLWRQVVARTNGEGFSLASVAITGCLDRQRWPIPAPHPPDREWSQVDVTGLPAALVATIRSGGSIVCLNAPAGEETSRANAAFFAAKPDLPTAEKEALAACNKPCADALNLLAAIRLASTSPTTDYLLQALAFSQQAVVLMPNHPFASINKIRALRGLRMRDEVTAALADLSVPATGSWQAKQIQLIREWLQEVRSGT